MEILDDLDSQHAASISREAVRLMSELDVSIIPTNFTVWFAYVIGRSPALRKTIDILRSNQRTFDKSLNRELYSTFLRSNSLVNAGQSITEELGIILRNVREDISEAIGTNNIHAAGLREVEASLGTEPPELILKHLVRELTLATERSSSLETRLAQASEELEKLRADLQEAETNSNTDALTGLANRRALDAFLRSQQIRAMEHGEALSVFLIDVDHFKAFNDKYGHQLGDQVLRLVAQCVRETIREADFAARFGGEELMCVLPGAAISACKEVAERVRRRIGDARLTKRATGEHVGQVTVSIGATEFTPGESYEALFERCDKALYQAKQLGRNCTVVS
jgi:diguanylate cyclase